jgi:hypothetical protein
VAISARGDQPARDARARDVRELKEEVGLDPQHVKILGRTRNWLRYEVPQHWIKREWRGSYRGQKQIWYLLRLTGGTTTCRCVPVTGPSSMRGAGTTTGSRLENVIEFKRDVYRRALTELERYLHRRPADPARAAVRLGAYGDPGALFHAAGRRKQLERARYSSTRLLRWIELGLVHVAEDRGDIGTTACAGCAASRSCCSSRARAQFPGRPDPGIRSPRRARNAPSQATTPIGSRLLPS